MKSLLPVLVLALSGCQTSSERLRIDNEPFSIQLMPTWTAALENGSVVLRQTDAPEDERFIVIRAVKKTDTHESVQSLSGLRSSVSEALSGLPDVVVSSAQDVSHQTMSGVRFDLSFRPPNRDSRYDRKQIALLGENHIFHIMHTAPSGATAKTDKLFDELVASLEEE